MLFRRKAPRSGLLPEYRRAYIRSVYGPWWSWTRWIGKPSKAYRKRMADALAARKSTEVCLFRSGPVVVIRRMEEE